MAQQKKFLKNVDLDNTKEEDTGILDTFVTTYRYQEVDDDDSDIGPHNKFPPAKDPVIAERRKRNRDASKSRESTPVRQGRSYSSINPSIRCIYCLSYIGRCLCFRKHARSLYKPKQRNSDALASILSESSTFVGENKNKKRKCCAPSKRGKSNTKKNKYVTHSTEDVRAKGDGKSKKNKSAKSVKQKKTKHRRTKQKSSPDLSQNSGDSHKTRKSSSCPICTKSKSSKSSHGSKNESFKKTKTYDTHSGRSKDKERARRTCSGKPDIQNKSKHRAKQLEGTSCRNKKKICCKLSTCSMNRSDTDWLPQKNSDSSTLDSKNKKKKCCAFPKRDKSKINKTDSKRSDRSGKGKSHSKNKNRSNKKKPRSKPKNSKKLKPVVSETSTFSGKNKKKKCCASPKREKPKVGKGAPDSKQRGKHVNKSGQTDTTSSDEDEDYKEKISPKRKNKPEARAKKSNLKKSSADVKKNKCCAKQKKSKPKIGEGTPDTSYTSDQESFIKSLSYTNEDEFRNKNKGKIHETCSGLDENQKKSKQRAKVKASTSCRSKGVCCKLSRCSMMGSLGSLKSILSKNKFHDKKKKSKKCCAPKNPKKKKGKSKSKSKTGTPASKPSGKLVDKSVQTEYRKWKAFTSESDTNLGKQGTSKTCRGASKDRGRLGQNVRANSSSEEDRECKARRDIIIDCKGNENVKHNRPRPNISRVKSCRNREDICCTLSNCSLIGSRDRMRAEATANKMKPVKSHTSSYYDQNKAKTCCAAPKRDKSKNKPSQNKAKHSDKRIVEKSSSTIADSNKCCASKKTNDKSPSGTPDKQKKPTQKMKPVVSDSSTFDDGNKDKKCCAAPKNKPKKTNDKKDKSSSGTSDKQKKPTQKMKPVVSETSTFDDEKEKKKCCASPSKSDSKTGKDKSNKPNRLGANNDSDLSCCVVPNEDKAKSGKGPKQTDKQKKKSKKSSSCCKAKPKGNDNKAKSRSGTPDKENKPTQKLKPAVSVTSTFDDEKEKKKCCATPSKNESKTSKDKINKPNRLGANNDSDLSCCVDPKEDKAKKSKGAPLPKQADKQKKKSKKKSSCCNAKPNAKAKNRSETPDKQIKPTQKLKPAVSESSTFDNRKEKKKCCVTPSKSEPITGKDISKKPNDNIGSKKTPDTSNRLSAKSKSNSSCCASNHKAKISFDAGDKSRHSSINWKSISSGDDSYHYIKDESEPMLVVQSDTGCECTPDGVMHPKLDQENCECSPSGRILPKIDQDNCECTPSGRMLPKTDHSTCDCTPSGNILPKLNTGAVVKKEGRKSRTKNSSNKKNKFSNIKYATYFVTSTVDKTNEDMDDSDGTKVYTIWKNMASSIFQFEEEEFDLGTTNNTAMNAQSMYEIPSMAQEQLRTIDATTQTTKSDRKNRKFGSSRSKKTNTHSMGKSNRKKKKNNLCLSNSCPAMKCREIESARNRRIAKKSKSAPNTKKKSRSKKRIKDKSSKSSNKSKRSQNSRKSNKSSGSRRSRKVDKKSSKRSNKSSGSRRSRKVDAKSSKRSNKSSGSRRSKKSSSRKKKKDKSKKGRRMREKDSRSSTKSKRSAKKKKSTKCAHCSPSSCGNLKCNYRSDSCLIPKKKSTSMPNCCIKLRQRSRARAKRKKDAVSTKSSKSSKKSNGSRKSGRSAKKPRKKKRQKDNVSNKSSKSSKSQRERRWPQ